jgi:hypothetical protein
LELLNWHIYCVEEDPGPREHLVRPQKRNQDMLPHHKTSQILLTLALVANFLWMLPPASAEVLLATAPRPSSLILDNCDLYWSDASEAQIKKISVHGGEITSLGTKMGVPANLAIHGQYIFWIDARSGISPTANCTGASAVTWILNRSSLDGTSKTELARGDHCEDRVADDLVVDATSVYWLNSTITPLSYTLKKVPVAGGDSTTLVTSQSTPIVALTSDTTHIYWAEDTYPEDPPSSSIKKMPKSGGQIEIVASGLKAIRGGLAIYNGEIFFVESNYFDTLTLMKVPVSGGSVTTLATVTRGPFEPKNDVKAITVDNENLYWVDKGAVNAVPVDGGEITTLASILNEPIDIAVIAGQVIWTESTGPAHGETGALKGVPTSGGSVSTLVQGRDAPRKLALYSNEIYWTEGGPIGLIEGFGEIAKIPATGGNVTTVILGIMSDSPPIASDGSYLYIGDRFSIKKVSIDQRNSEKLHTAFEEIGDLATDGSNVYWISRPFSTVHKIPVSGGPVATLASELVGLSGPIRVHNGYVYWMANQETISKVSVGGGQVITLASGLPFLNDFVVDDTDAYFSEHDTGALRKISINGGPITTLAYRSPMSSPRHLALDSQNLYWIDQLDVGKIPIDGGTPTFFVSGDVDSDPYFPPSIAVDFTGLYWTETATGQIIKYTFGEECIPVSKAIKAMPWIPLLLLGD